LGKYFPGTVFVFLDERAPIKLEYREEVKPMRVNLHTHTWRCNHAKGMEEEYISAAIDQGFDILGFADHTPQFFPGEYYSGFRMRPELLQNYCSTVRGLSRQYASQIQIPLGLEVEYYPALLPQVLPVLQDQGVEYLLLGQHFVGNEIGEHYCGAPTSDESILKRYCAQSADAMQTGLFTYFAHPDLLYFCGDDRVYRKYMRELVREAKSCNMALEINVLGKWAGRNYPDLRFWELAAEEGCQAVLGWDAHAPEHLKREAEERKLRSMARELGIPILDTVPLQSIL